MEKSQPRIVIIGGGFGGISAARALYGAPVKVTLIDKRNFHLFQPLLYQVATGLLCPSEVTAPLRHILKNQQNTTVLLGEVVNIDPKRKIVVLNDGEIGYDILIVATGMINHYYGHDEWERHAPGLKTIEDTARIRQRIFLAFEIAERESILEQRKQWLTFIVVGSGATGVELSGMIAEIAMNTLKDEFRSIRPEESQIILIDAAEFILPAYPEKLSRITEKALNSLGVCTYTGTRVVDIDEQGVTVERAGGRVHIPARTVIWSSGVMAAALSKILAQNATAGTDQTGRIIVNSDMTIPGHPEIFVIGDAAHYRGKNGRPLPGLAPVATQEGRYVAEVIRQRLSGNALIQPFSYFDKGTMAVIGRHSAVADIGKWHFGGRFAWLLWLFIHLILLVKFENRLIVFIRWAFQYFSYSRGARNLNLRGVLRLPISQAHDRP